MARARVVIIGGGFAGVATARELERAGKSEVDVTLVSRQNFMLFTPMLPEVAAGSIDAQDIMQPLRTAGRDRRNAGGSSRFELGEAIGVDVARRTVTVRNPVTHDSKLLEYDELVLAVGATESTMGVPGVEKFAVPLKTIEEAQMVRSRVVGALEAAATTSDLAARDRLLRFVVIGGDFTGVELAGELLAFLHAILGYYPSIDRAAGGGGRAGVRRETARPLARQIWEVRGGGIEQARREAALERRGQRDRRPRRRVKKRRTHRKRYGHLGGRRKAVTTRRCHRTEDEQARCDRDGSGLRRVRRARTCGHWEIALPFQGRRAGPMRRSRKSRCAKDRCWREISSRGYAADRPPISRTRSSGRWRRSAIARPSSSFPEE